MNPFELRGPEFLLFYIALGTVVVFLLARRSEESDAVALQPDLSDPYLLAFMRGGEEEALELATLSLLDRGLLVQAGGTVQTAADNAPDLVKYPTEKIVLNAFRTPAAPSAILPHLRGDHSFRKYEEALLGLGILPDENTKRLRERNSLLAVTFMLTVAAIKVAIGLSRNRPVLFLIVLAGLSAVILLRIGNPRLTKRGEKLLADIRTLFGSLKRRAATLAPRVSSGETVLLAAVFGVGAASLIFRPYLPLFRRPQSGGSSGSCSSGCGSSCGGGCGGGCGGCGS